jgi:lactoylglutathione lyase
MAARTAGCKLANPRLQQTMIRIKDPKVSVPFYIDNFGMKLIHWIDFPQWTFTVYFLEKQRDGQTSPECTLEKATQESEAYLNSMTGATIELTHNHGSESDDTFSVWNGNTGKDADGPNYAEEPAVRGFGHIAFNTDDVYDACAILEKNGVKFQKKPDEGRMKGLAFALDPDGYWLEIVKRKPGLYNPVTEYYNLSQTMLRVKDGPASVAFYTKHMGMTLVSQRDFPQWKFSLYFLVSATEEELRAAFDAQSDEVKAEQGGSWDTFDPTKPNELTSIMWNTCLELTYNHGTELIADFKVHDGNAKPQGFGHIGFLMDSLTETCDAMEKDGVSFKKKEQDGNMRGIAFVYDPDGYWVELIDRKAKFSGICANY